MNATAPSLSPPLSPPAAPGGVAGGNPAASTCATLRLCSHSIAGRLSKKLAFFTAVVIGLVCAASWFSVAMMVQERNLQDLGVRCDLLADILSLEARNGGEAAVLERLRTDAPMRASSRLQVWRGDGSLLWADSGSTALLQSKHQRAHSFQIATPGVGGGSLRATYTVDFTRSAEMGARWALILAATSLSAGVVVALGAGWFVRRSLKPLHLLAAQTRAISPQQLRTRLALADPAEELLPFIEQFNALMDRLQRAYEQLEAFNADVAHELRTPLATLIGETEVTLSRERSPQVLQETLQSNLEEMQRLSALVNDMLFLSQADRGVTARRGQPVSLAALARQVSEFHEIVLEDAGLQLRIDGEATLAVDEPLVKRALSNLLGNATRFARPGSTVVVEITRQQDPAAGGAVSETGGVRSAGPVWQLVVQNEGQAVAPEHLPRLFNRFFRADDARCCEDAQHHGLGLAIVAAIARMHGGSTLASSAGGITRIGFTLAQG